MQLTLTPDESRLLIRHLTQEIEHLDAELIHTDKRELQRALAHELDALRGLTERIRFETGERLQQDEPRNIV